MISFGAASLLLLAIPALAVVAIASRTSAQKLSRGRRIAAAIARGGVIALLTLAIARPVLTHPAEQPKLTVFLADVSDSVPPGAWPEAGNHLATAWQHEIQKGNRCALVAFAGGAEVLVPPTNSPLEIDGDLLAHREALEKLRAAAEAGERAGDRIDRLREWTEKIQSSRTDLDTAVRAAGALFEAGSTGRLVLLSDGRFTTGPTNRVELPPGTVFIPLHGPGGPDVAVVETIAPLAVRSGEPFDVRVTIQTSSAANFRLLVSIDDVEVPESAHSISVSSAGRHSVLVENLQQARPLEIGIHRIGVLAEAEADGEPRNNSGGTAVTVTGKPRVLLIEGASGEAEVLFRLLQAQDIDLVREGPGRIRATDARLEEFVAVVLAGCSPEIFTPRAARTLRDYVEASGGGLFLVGSSRLAKEPSLSETPIAPLLPVRFIDVAPVAGPEKPDLPRHPGKIWSLQKPVFPVASSPRPWRCS